jgi:hypothetical protein
LISLFHHRVQAQVMGDAVDVSQDFQHMETAQCKIKDKRNLPSESFSIAD